MLLDFDQSSRAERPAEVIKVAAQKELTTPSEWMPGPHPPIAGARASIRKRSLEWLHKVEPESS
jgi:hypothetical protein